MFVACVVAAACGAAVPLWLSWQDWQELRRLRRENAAAEKRVLDLIDDARRQLEDARREQSR